MPLVLPVPAADVAAIKPNNDGSAGRSVAGFAVVVTFGCTTV
jgi:hypothetical protein